MAKKKVTVDEEMLRGIMAADVPIYGKDSSKKQTPAEEPVEQVESVQENADNPPVEKIAAKPRKRKDDTDSYRKQFLMGGNIRNRQQVYICLNNFQFLRQFLSVVAPGISMSKFVDDVLTAHLEQYREEIDSLYNNQINNNPLYK